MRSQRHLSPERVRNRSRSERSTYSTRDTSSRRAYAGQSTSPAAKQGGECFRDSRTPSPSRLSWKQSRDRPQDDHNVPGLSRTNPAHPLEHDARGYSERVGHHKGALDSQSQGGEGRPVHNRTVHQKEERMMCSSRNTSARAPACSSSIHWEEHLHEEPTLGTP